MITFEPFKIWCLKQGKKQIHVAEETGINKVQVNRIFNDKASNIKDVLEILCKTYNLKVEEIIEHKTE